MRFVQFLRDAKSIWSIGLCQRHLQSCVWSSIYSDQKQVPQMHCQMCKFQRVWLCSHAYLPMTNQENMNHFAQKWWYLYKCCLDLDDLDVYGKLRISAFCCDQNCVEQSSGCGDITDCPSLWNWEVWTDICLTLSCLVCHGAACPCTFKQQRILLWHWLSVYYFNLSKIWKNASLFEPASYKAQARRKISPVHFTLC